MAKLANCYAQSLHRPDLGEIRPGDLAVKYGRATRDDYQQIWRQAMCSRPAIHVLNAACKDGLILDGLEMLDNNQSLLTSDKDYLVAAFTKEFRHYTDFHFASMLPGKPWMQGYQMAYGEGEEVFLVTEEISDAKNLMAGLHGYDFLCLARVPETLYADLGVDKPAATLIP